MMSHSVLLRIFIKDFDSIQLNNCIIQRWKVLMKHLLRKNLRGGKELPNGKVLQTLLSLNECLDLIAEE